MRQLVKAILILFIAQSCVGINIVLSKDLVSHISPLILLIVRFSISSFFISILLVFSNSADKFRLSLSKTDWLILALEGICAGSMFNFLMLTGLNYTNANSAGLITSLLPAVVICLNILFFKQKLTIKMSISIIISVIGLVFINYGAGTENTNSALFGNFLVFAALIPDGLYYALSKYHPVKINTLLKVLIINAVNLPILILIIPFLPSGSFSAISVHDWILIVIVGITSAFFFILWQKGILYVDAAYSALSTAFMPISTVILAWIILGEGLSVYKLVGMILVILSIVNYALKK